VAQERWVWLRHARSRPRALPARQWSGGRLPKVNPPFLTPCCGHWVESRRTPLFFLTGPPLHSHRPLLRGAKNGVFRSASWLSAAAAPRKRHGSRSRLARKGTPNQNMSIPDRASGVGAGKKGISGEKMAAWLESQVNQRWFRAKLHQREHHEQPGFPYICRASVLNCYVQPPGGTVRVLHLVQGYFAHQEAHACARKCIDFRKLLAARSFAFHTAIMSGPGAPPRGFCTLCAALALLNRDASPETCTRSEPIHRPPPPPKAAHAAHTS